MHATELPAFLAQILIPCIDIRAVWSIADAEAGRTAACHELLAFADMRTLQRLRRSPHLHCAAVQLLVVYDGDRFENAWGPRRLSGSLARWAWREETARLAYYDESRWAHDAGGGAVVRVRRRAILLWSSPQVAALADASV